MEDGENRDRLVGAMADGVVAIGPDGRYTDVNDAFLDLVGFDREAVLGAPPSLVHDEAGTRSIERAIEALGDGSGAQAETLETEIQTAEGDLVPVELRLSRPDASDEFEGVVGVLRGVSGRERRERDVEQYKRVLEVMGDGVYAIDENGRYTMMNQYLADLAGYDRDRILGSEPMLFHDESEIRAFDAAIRSLLGDDGGVETLETTLETATGSEAPVEVNLTLLPRNDGEFRGTVGVVRDVTERKRRERDLERYARLVEASGDAMYALDTDGRFTFSNEAHQAIVDRHESELLGEHASIALPDEAVADGEELIGGLLDSDNRQGTFEMDVLRPDGERIPTENHVALLTDEDGEFRGTVGVLRDISERLRRERELERYERLVEASGDAVYALDTRGRFTFSNEAHQAVVDRDESELIGEHASIALPDEAVADGEELIRELLESDRRNGTFEMDVLRPDGERIPTENHVALLTDEDGEFRGTVGILRDISERQRRERELERQNERLERFASIVSHDLRNPLTVARGYLELVDSDDEAIRKVGEALDRIETIVEDVLELSQQGRTIDEPAPVELGDVARMAWTNVETPGATLAVDGDAVVLADESRLIAVLENLFRNAVEHGTTSLPSSPREDAVEHGSTSPRSHTREDAGESGAGSLTVHVGATADGFYVADDGPGIPTDERERIFDVGYTTGENGTGQGLAIVDEIASAHGWDLSVTESADGGARFTFGNVSAAEVDD